MAFTLISDDGNRAGQARGVFCKHSSTAAIVACVETQRFYDFDDTDC
jgi:hypothetical protein